MLDEQTVKILCQGLLGQGNFIPVQKLILKGLKGDYPSSVMLAQLIYWSTRPEEEGKPKPDYVYKTFRDWENELVLGKKASSRATSVLKEAGLIMTLVKRAPNGNSAVHYKIIWANVAELLGSSQRALPEVPNRGKGKYPKGTNIETKNTTKTTTNIKRESTPLHKNISASDENPKTSQPQASQANTNNPLKAEIVVASETLSATASTEIITYLNQQTGSTFKPAACATVITAALKKGFTVSDMKRIVDNTAHWTNDDRNRVFLKPSHIFGKSAHEFLALPPQRAHGGKNSAPSYTPSQYYLVDPAEFSDAVLVNEEEIPVGTDVWDKAGREISI